jgi:competence ComEA-like helix-hairpin-helix protein
MKRFFIILIFLFFPALVLAEQIDINSATLSQLDELTGIGPKYAQAIIDGRPYSSVDDLDKVKGIGPATLQKIKAQGLACVACATQANLETQNSKSETNSNSQNPNIQNATGYPTGVFINEIMPNPEGGDETNEWLELYNSNNFDVNLSGWKIQDKTGTVTTYKISEGTKILANGFLVFKRPDTKIMLNNDEDGLNLLTPDGKNTDTVSFTKAPLNQSYGKTPARWAWSATPTPGAANIITGLTKTAKKQTVAPTKVLPKDANSVNNNVTEAGLADISQTSNPWFLFFIALAITIISAVFVLLIKLKLKNHVRT